MEEQRESVRRGLFRADKLLALAASAVLALAVYGALDMSGSAGPDLLPEAEAHAGNIHITNAVLTNHNTILVTYSGSIAPPSSRQVPQSQCYGAFGCSFTGYKTVWNVASRYSDVSMNPGGAMGIDRVSFSAYNAHFIHLSGSVPSPDATGSLSVASSGSVRWTNSQHSHTRDAATVTVHDGQGPGLASSGASLDLNAGIFSFTANEDLQKSATDPSKITIAGVNLSSATVLDLGGERSVSIIITEGQRSSLAALQDGAGLTADFAGAALADAAGNRSGPASGVQISLTKDTTPPALSLASSSLDLGTGTMRLMFTEYVDVSEADMSAVRLQNPSGSAGFSLAGSAVLEEDDGYGVSVQLSDLQRAQIVNPAAFPAGAAPETVPDLMLPVIREPQPGAALTHLKVDPAAFRDLAGIALSRAVEGQIPATPDATAPSVLGSPAPSLALDTGVLRFEFDEYVNARAVDFDDMAIKDRFDGSVSLENAGVRSDGKTVILTLPDRDREAAINMQTDLLLHAKASAVKDVSGNGIAESDTGIEVARDRTAPSLVRASLDPSSGNLALVFSETVDATPSGQVVLSKMSLRAPQTAEADAVRLSSGQDRATVTTAADGPRVDITLTASQRSALAAGQSATLLLSLEADAVRDLSNNPVQANSELRVGTSLDLGGPTALSVSLETGTGTMTVTFDETVDATPASKVDTSKFSIRDSSGGADAVRTALTSAKVSEFDRLSLELKLTEAQRQAALSYGGAPLLDIAAGAVRDSADNPSSATSDMTVNVTGTDTLVPGLLSAYLNWGTGNLEMLFGETVDVSEIDLAKLRIQEIAVVVEAPENTGPGVCMPDLNNINRWHGGPNDGQLCTPPTAPPPVPQAFVQLKTDTTSASVLTTADGASATVALTDEQLGWVEAFERAAQLDIEAGAVKDTSANPIQARSDVPLSVQADTVPPALVSAVITGPDSVRVQFSEDLLNSSVTSSDFAVRGHAIAGITETKGTVDIDLSTRIDNTSGQTVRVSVTGSVSDTEDNVLDGAVAQIYIDAPNDLVFADVAEFTVSSSNPNPVYARAGDTVTLTFKADVDILPANETGVLFNLNDAASVSSVTARGFTATYVVQQSDRDGPLDLVVAVETSDAISAFTEADITSGGNVTVDTTPPRYLSATLAGMQSIHVHYSEPVKTSASDYTGIGIGCPDCTPQPASSASNPGPSSHVLVSWATEVPDTERSDVEFTISSSVTDLAGNALSNSGAKTMPPPENLEAVSRLQLDTTDSGVSGVALPHDTLVRTVVATPGTVPVIDVSGFKEPGSVHGGVAGAGGNRVQFPSGSELTVDTDRATVTFQPMVQAGGFPNQDGADAGSTITVDVSQKDPDSEFMDMHPHVDPEFSLILEFGRPDVDLAFSAPVSVALKSDILPSSTVFTINAAGSTREVLECGDGVEDSATALDFITSSVAPLGSATVDGGACVDKDFNIIWTMHFSAFGVSLPSPSSSARSSCDDCTPPTLGRNEGGDLVVAGGFTYNGREVNVETFFTAYPRIETQVGSPNVAVVKIYENGGSDNIRHASLAFGLRSGEVISESTAAIEWNRNHAGAESVTLFDPHDAIDSASLSVDSSETECAAGSSLQCLQLEFRHTFRAPLEYDIVGTNVWDADRNAWQNYFNHGIHIDGESLNEMPGMLVDGMRLYPIRAGSDHVTVMSDGAGQLYRLAPDGQYRPLTNSSALYRTADESIWLQANGMEPMGSYDRHDPRFAGELASEELAALEVLAGLTRNAPLENPGFGAPAPLVYYEQTYSDRSSDEALGAAILAERERAALLYDVMFANRR